MDREENCCGELSFGESGEPWLAVGRKLSSEAQSSGLAFQHEFEVQCVEEGNNWSRRI